MISGHTLAKNLRQWGVVFGSGLAGLALGLILFGLYGLDGIFHALNTVPIAAGVLYPFTGLLLNPMIASAAMSASSILVIGNSLRLRRVAL